ncbi:glycosyltransferase [Paraburkholderia sp. A1BS-2L]|uniref:glycosyltransferase n=1 Tax=Paraburkholderia sp. A1BS-2L TaxID=3028373 RepID=UPI003DA7C49A
MANKVKVGIVIVTYNSADVFALAAESLVRTRSDTKFAVAVIDNASADAERVVSRRVFDEAVSQGVFEGVFFQQDKNLGFSGGNNIGIEHFLKDPSITHICLLNSDVIVTDHWLDYLVAQDKDAIGPLTNASNNEQGIPIPYELGDRAKIPQGSAAFDLESLERFARDRRDGWLGDVVESDFLSYYCVLFSRLLIEQVGLLDTRFFPGAYEDDDYCVRTLQGGFKMHVARDVYMHHWGSASFGKLDALEAQGFAAANRARFEEKYGRTWNDRTYLSVTAWKDDALFAVGERKHPPLHCQMHDLYAVQLTRLVDGLESYRTHLKHEIASRRSVQARDLKTIVFGDYPDDDSTPPSLVPAIQSISAEVAQYLTTTGEWADEDTRERLRKRFVALEKSVDALVAETKGLLATLNAIPAAAPEAGTGWRARIAARLAKAAEFPTSRVSRMARALEFIDLMIGGNGIMFVAPFPTKARERDGYFQRVRAIDSLYPQSRRVYCDVREGGAPKPFIERAEKNSWVLNVEMNSRAHRYAACLLAFRFKRVYFHSVLRMANRIGEALLRVPGVKWVLDVHGVVPEEFRMHNDFYSARIHDDCERNAVENASFVVVVSESMGAYLAHKYRDLLRAKVIVLPIFSADEWSDAARSYVDGKPVVIYAGGTQRWQKVPEMMRVVRDAVDYAHWWIYTPDVDVMRNAAAPEVVHHPQFHVASATRAELSKIYESCHFGFVLRDDMVVNNVSCPTKLIEYLAFGIVPIVDTPNIGDFNANGMRYVTAEDFSKGLIPGEAERLEMAAHNRAICVRLVEQKAAGEQQLVAAVA